MCYDFKSPPVTKGGEGTATPFSRTHTHRPLLSVWLGREGGREGEGGLWPGFSARENQCAEKERERVPPRPLPT